MANNADSADNRLVFGLFTLDLAKALADHRYRTRRFREQPCPADRVG